MTTIALTNGEYADLIIAADTNIGGMYPLPNGQYAQAVVPVDADGNVIVSGEGGGSGSGFTYDQQTTPSSPTRGQTWRERDSNNDIVEDWFWNGTYWLSIQIHSHFVEVASSNFTPFPALNSEQILALKVSIVATSGNMGDNDASNFTTYTFRSKNNAAFSETVLATLTSQALLNGQNLLLSADINQVLSNTNISSLVFRYAATGSPSEPIQGNATFWFRLIK
ncbi:hypothetical protein [Nostoc sp. UHCC 0251]|uniref:hypothetical protein n=1 Tax=Nostoc sp. UHCC 0251 TaxID=3110240 RepID=UPI002B1E9B21|nr:hypothetical protein [Nostoc sp. UHCC 0251]MEA5625328.1 hypothetical protein [Nostoc sp. UHCC 0251]